ncbi:trypsin-1-like [Oratosquilla oratoria]|uniref:trypsin-1-like n=1 Tax=Oratosquilla oratoria TaxID=337810 RepID=UPI003F7612C3
MKIFLLALLVVFAYAVPATKPRFHRGLHKIVGGTEAKTGEFPYQISFQFVIWGTGYHFCGGSIYDENFVITAGHCVYDEDYYNPQSFQIVAGEHNFEEDDGTEQVVEVVQLILHEDFDPESLVNDIALLRLGRPLRMNDFVSGIDLETSSVEGDCVVSGWGDLHEAGGPSPSILMKVIVPIVSDDQCRGSYGRDRILDSMICAGGDGERDSCLGDSGGPLACHGRLAGVVSWGRGCARPGYPGVYTEVSYFADWIRSHAV